MSITRREWIKMGPDKIRFSEITESEVTGDGELIRGRWGETVEAGYYINIDSKQPQLRKVETLLHELDHVISWVGGLNFSEEIVRAHSLRLAEILLRNPWIKDYIWYGK